jgi:FkbM family methyltransferase
LARRSLPVGHERTLWEGLAAGARRSVKGIARRRAASAASAVSAQALRSEPDLDDLRMYPGYRREDLAVFDAFGTAHVRPSAGFVTDFIGSRARIAALWDGVEALDGVVLPRPIPADFHSEAIEWLGVLKSVLAAPGRLVAMELGAGMAPWLVVAATAARLRGIADITLVGVEADPGRFALMESHLRDNGLDPAAHALFQAAVGVSAGTAKWPRLTNPRNDAGARPVRHAGADGAVLDAGDVRYLGAAATDLIDVNIMAFDDLLRLHPQWDLVHIDVQGGECDLCRSALPLLTERVRYLVVGTHSRKLDGDLIEIMVAGGWNLEHEKPARMVFNPGHAVLENMTTHDGTQVWRNPAV